MEDEKNTAREVVQRLGGQSAVARECRVTQQAVHGWCVAGRIPPAREQYLRLAHPEAFEGLGDD